MTRPPSKKRRVLLAKRAVCCARILDMLKLAPLTSEQVALALDISPISSYRYLAHMRDELRQIHAVPADSTRKMNQWVLGAGSAPSAKDEGMDRSFAQRRVIAPARQVGMVRDSLIAALFGPAGERRP